MLSRKAREWLDGELLGDGSISKPKFRYAACFTYGSKYLEYVQYVASTLKDFGIGQTGKINEYVRKDGSGSGFFYKSNTYAELLPFRARWYSNDKKIVPRDIKLTPITCRQWYIGDGSLVKPRVSKRSYIVLCTDSFPVEDVQWLVERLADIGLLATRTPSKNRIQISGYSTLDFLNYIGECPVECYLYKWDCDNIV